ATPSGADRGRVPAIPRFDPRQEGVRPHRGGDPTRGEGVWGHGVHRALVEDAATQTAEGGVDPPTEGREPAGVEATDRRRTRDREDEGVAGGGRTVAQSASP